MIRSPAIPAETVAWTVAAFLVCATPHLAAMPLPLAGVIVAACLWRVAVARYRWRLPGRVTRIALALAAMAAVAFAYGGLWGRRAATTLLCMMLAAKMLELARVRDLRMVAAVSFFLIAAQFLFNERLVLLFYLLAGAVVASAALRVIQDHAAGSPGVPDVRRRLAGALRLVLAALPVAITLFVLFPRLAQPLWGLPEHVMDGRSGLSNEMSPGRIANLYLDFSPAFRVEFDGRVPSPAQLYWRGPVLWAFDGETWRRSPEPSLQPTRPVPPGETDWHYEIQLEAHERRWLFVLDWPVRGPDSATITPDYQLHAEQPVTTLKHYRARSNPHFIASPRLLAPMRRQALQLPEGRNPRTRRHAAELRRQHTDDRALVSAALAWLEQDDFSYSLETEPLGRHGADELLFDLQEGYCEYYASAFAVLMRAAGIPARIVTGYQGGTWQGDDYLLVRQSDAHAWVEVWLDGAGWMRVDPTAAISPTRIENGARSAVAHRRALIDAQWLIQLRNRLDRVQHWWNDWILGFDADRQQRMFRFLGMARVSPAVLAVVMVAVLAMVIAPLLFNAVRAGQRSRDPVERAWQRLLARLARAGLAHRPSETPLEYARRIAPQLPDQAGELINLAQTYCRLHYGPGDRCGVTAFCHRAGRFRPRRPSHEPTLRSAI